MPVYIPGRGDFVTVSFDPQSGHEQKGRRPALIISNYLFNKHTGLTIACPIITTKRNFPFHIKVPDGICLSGYIMVEHIKSINYRSRNVKFLEKAPKEVINEALAILDACIYQEA
ncbi:MAG: type II toxin-antitoxin system PemK/MazF family toxin [Planctomycetes bacterium]|nr:type II toxin-antitoxin system PemK/MazF family toxin [Planctomycetota bacterium]